MTATEATAPAENGATSTADERQSNGTTREEGGPTRAQEYVARVQQLRDSGMQASDAYKKVAEENGVAVSTVRGAVYRAGGTRSNGTTKPPADPTEAAAQLFRDAIARIDSDLQVLRDWADQAKRDYAQAKTNAGDLRKKYEDRINALGQKVERAATPTA